MKKLIIAALAFLPMFAMAETSLSMGLWDAVYDDDGNLNFSYNGQDALLDVYATMSYRIVDADKGGSFDTRSIAAGSAKVVDIEDEFGVGKSLQISHDNGTVVMTRHHNFYETLPYMIVSASLKAHDGSVVATNNVKPFVTETKSSPLKGSSNRMLWVPYDNDAHGRYEVYTFNQQKTSYEVSVVWDASSRFGLVAGSVDHDKWKSGITFKGSQHKHLTKLECLSGIVDGYTRDRIAKHGYVKGTEVSSARYMIGFFDDWRVGMETFADACTTVAPRAVWEGGNPMGWSSWGVLQDHVNYQSVVDCATFMKEELYDLGFHDKDGQLLISLDSFAEGGNISASEMAKLGKRVLGSGTYKDGRETKQGLNQRVGCYGGLVIWEWSFDGHVPGTGYQGQPAYKWRDCMLKVNGQPYSVMDGGQYYAIDPTHPAVRQNMEYTFQKWASYNVKYVKFDFINAAGCEGDSWYNPEITTGKMAYNYGMKIVHDLAAQYGMYVLESMAPLFPYRWAHGRRMMCDRFSELGESEYTLNGLSWAWWTDRLYTVNDPDHLVLRKHGYNGAETAGENRVRATSGMVSGAYLFGDNFSDAVNRGYPAASREVAATFMGNADINEYVRNNVGSFRPVEGGDYTSSQQCERKFMRETDRYLYIAVFNWSKYLPMESSITWERLGFDPDNVGEIKELWSGATITPTEDGISYEIPGGDVFVFRVSKKNYDGIENIRVDETVSGPAEYYNLQGVKVADNYRGYCIKVQNGKAMKIFR